MAFRLAASGMTSRSVRRRVTGNRRRRISVGAVSAQADEQGGFLSSLLDSGLRFIASEFTDTYKTLKPVLSINFSDIWGAIVRKTSTLWHFNWRVTDKELDDRVKSAFESLGSHLGEFAGSTFGWLACGAVPGLIIFSFNEALALHVLKNVGEEAFNELVNQATNVLHSLTDIAAKAAFAWAYKNARNLLLREDGLLDGAVSLGIVDAQAAADFKKAAQSEEPWSFALETEERIESIKPTFWRNFAEGFAEGASESCVEAGYVVANSLDSYFAQQQISNATAMGTDALVEISLPST